MSLVDIRFRCQHVTDYVFHLLPQIDKNRHISGMREEIKKRHGEKLGIIIGNVLSRKVKLVPSIEFLYHRYVDMPIFPMK